MNTLPWSTSAYERIAALVAARAGFSFSPSLRDQAESGIRRSMARSGTSDPGLYGARLESDGDLLDDLVSELAVSETYFFRDPAQFEFLRQGILPEILGRRGPDHGLRLLSAGCSSGEEAYSIAILLEEEVLAGQSRVVGADLSRTALEKARRGIYGKWSLRASEGDFVSRYFRARDDRYQLEERFRKAVTFQHLNLAQELYPSTASGIRAFDVIFCRNVLIYFDAKTIEGVTARLLDSLAPGGWLVAGASDPPLSDYAPCEVVLAKGGVYYRRREEPHGLRGLPRAAELTPLPTPRPDPEPAGEAPEKARGPEGSEAPASFDSGRLEEAEKALGQGEYGRALELSEGLSGIPGAEVLRLRATANLRGSQEAERLAGERIGRYPMIPELHFFRAIFLVDLARGDDAIGCLKKVLYLDPTLAVANLTLGTLLGQRGDRAGARRCLGAALRELSLLGEDEVVPLSQGELAGDLAATAKSELELLEGDR